MRTELVTRLRSDVVPMAFFQPTKRPGYNRIAALITLRSNPMQVLTTLIGKPPRYIKPNVIRCLGVYKPQEFEGDDLFAALE